MSGMMPFAAESWGVDSESFHVGARIAPAGVAAARQAVCARGVGDMEAVRRYASQAMAADHFANAARSAGRAARRGNVAGNAWSFFYECITGRASGW